MSSTARNTRQVRPAIPLGADPTTYRTGAKKERRTRQQQLQAHFDNMTPEEREEDRRQRAAFNGLMAQWRKDFDEFGPARASELLSARRANMARHPKVVDREARAAVEGNTDINHDNLEEPVVSPEWVEVGGYVDTPEAPAGYSVEIRVDHLGVVAAYRFVRASE